MGMKRDDPKRIAAYEKRERADAWLEVLCNGIGLAFQNSDRRYYPETIRLIIERVNGELSEAVDAAELARKEYEPYWRRRRIAHARPRKVKKAA
jgi:hypothetical protein